MSNPKLWQQYSALLSNADFIVSYSALSDEIPIEKTPHFKLVKNKPTFVVPPTHKIEPEEVAKNLLKFVENYTLLPTPYSLIIFLPGQKFDLTGTRHGRGFGWYDRLLAELPSNWIRVGVAKACQVSAIPLNRNKWDQPVDWLICKVNENLWNIKITEERSSNA